MCKKKKKNIYIYTYIYIYIYICIYNGRIVKKIQGGWCGRGGGGGYAVGPVANFTQ